ncbi:MAG: hypothetical protein AAF600_11360 [Bacteroidota bacterium]
MRLLIIIILIIISVSGIAQTWISPPLAKINLAELSEIDPEKKKNLKLKDRFKDKKTRSIEKKLKKYTGFEKRKIRKYKVMFRSLDSLEMEQLEEDLERIIENQNQRNKIVNTSIKEEKKRARKWKQVKTEYIEDSTSLKSDQFRARKTTANIQLFDTLSSLFGKEYELKLDDQKIVLDSSAFDSISMAKQKPIIDSSYLVGNPAPKLDLDTGLVNYSHITKKSPLNDTLQEENLNDVEIFMESFIQKRIKNQDLSVLTVEDQTPTIQQFIPELEKFDYQKPNIPKEKITKAIIRQEKEKQKDQLKDALLPKFQNDEDVNRTIDWANKWKIGGYVEYKPENDIIEMTPTLAYGINEKLSLGIGYTTTILLKKDQEIDRQNAYRTYLDYALIHSFFLHIESEWKEQKKLEQATVKERSTLFGLGRTFTYKAISTSVLGLFNFNAPNAIDTRKFSLRFAINFNL